MSKNKQNLFFFIFLIFTLILNTVIADDYITTGGSEQDFNTGSMSFVAGQDTDLHVAILQKGYDNPVIGDINNDSINEIIVIDGDNIKIFQNKTLDLLQTFVVNFTATSNNLSNFWIQDLNSDGYNDLIFGEWGNLNTAEHLPHIIYYNGSELKQRKVCTAVSGDKGGSTTSLSSAQIGCNSDNTCLYVVGGLNGVSNGHTSFFRYAFNWSDCGGTNITEIGALNNIDTQCSPHIKSLQISDVDGDGVEEAVHSFLTSRLNGDGSPSPNQEILLIRGYDFNADLTTSLTITGQKILTNFYTVTIDGSTSVDCQNTLSNYISPPLIGDFSSNFGKEIVVGANFEIDSFRLYMFDKDGTYMDQFPELTDGEGRIVSNVVRARVFSDSTQDDFCIMGSDDVTGNSLDFLCGSKSRTGFFSDESEEFVVTLDPLPYNITNLLDGFRPPYQTIHAVNTISTLTDGKDLSEFLMTFGTFKLDFTGVNTLDIDYVDEVGAAVKIPVDYAGEGKDDIIALSSTNLYYIDDGFSLLGCGDTGSYCIDDIFFRPCNTQVWEFNTTVEVRVTLEDFHDGELTEINMTLYYDDLTNEQPSNWLGNYSSGTIVPYTFKANKTTNSGILRVEVRNPNRPSSIQVEEFDFVVSTVGINWEDGITCTNDIFTSDEEIADSNVTAGETETAKETSKGFIRTLFGVADDNTNFDTLIGFGIVVVILILGLYIAKKEFDLEDKSLLMVGLIFAVVGWIFLIAIGLIGAWTLIITIIIVAAIMSLSFIRRFNSNDN